MAEHGHRALTWALALVAVLALGLGLAQAAGWVQLIEVQGGSMQPTIPNGSLLVSVPRHVSELERGDVVSLVRFDGSRVTHRVVDVNADGELITRGDANTVNDPVGYAGVDVDLVVMSIPGNAGVVWRYVQLLTGDWWMRGALGLIVLVSLPWERLRRRKTPTADEELLAVMSR